METRSPGGTDMRVGVPGSGGAEIGFERAGPRAVARLPGESLGAGPDVIDTAGRRLDEGDRMLRGVDDRRPAPLSDPSPDRSFRVAPRGLRDRATGGRRACSPGTRP